MSLTTTSRRAPHARGSRGLGIASATLLLLTAAAGVAPAAQAPIVSAQKIHRTAIAPATFPFTAIEQGERLPKGAVVVYRTITLSGDQQVKVTMRAPAGKRLRSLAASDVADIAGSYAPVGSAGRRSVTAEMFKSAEGPGKVSGRLYALAR